MGTVTAWNDNFGVMWYDNSKKLSAEDKIREALWQYQDLIGSNPVYCVVNSATGYKNNIMLFGMIVRVRDDIVKPNYFWLKGI
jgi:hypothetical protein